VNFLPDLSDQRRKKFVVSSCAEFLSCGKPPLIRQQRFVGTGWKKRVESHVENDCFYPAMAELSSLIRFPRQRWHEKENIHSATLRTGFSELGHENTECRTTEVRMANVE
jgi:hypothetical protein